MSTITTQERNDLEEVFLAISCNSRLEIVKIKIKALKMSAVKVKKIAKLSLDIITKNINAHKVG